MQKKKPARRREAPNGLFLFQNLPAGQRRKPVRMLPVVRVPLVEVTVTTNVTVPETSEPVFSSR